MTLIGLKVYENESSLPTQQSTASQKSTVKITEQPKQGMNPESKRMILWLVIGVIIVAFTIGMIISIICMV